MRYVVCTPFIVSWESHSFTWANKSNFLLAPLSLLLGPRQISFSDPSFSLFAPLISHLHNRSNFLLVPLSLLLGPRQISFSDPSFSLFAPPISHLHNRSNFLLAPMHSSTPCLFIWVLKKISFSDPSFSLHAPHSHLSLILHPFSLTPLNLHIPPHSLFSLPAHTQIATHH